METKLKITVPKPCHENWDEMTPDETGRFCGSCVKSVVDFTDMKATEIQNYFIINQGERICGRFKNEQLNKFDIQIPQSVLNQRMSFHKAFLLTLFVVMGSTLFSCKNHDDASLGEVSVVKDTVEATHTLGVILPPKDSIAKYDSVKKLKKIKTVLPIITGDVEIVRDTIKKPNSKSVYNASEVETLPNYPGGLSKFYEYFNSNFKVSKENMKSGKIIATFVVDTDGSLIDVYIIRGVNEISDRETARVLRSSPKWSPGEVNGEKVKVSYSLPIKITAQ